MHSRHGIAAGDDLGFQFSKFIQSLIDFGFAAIHLGQPDIAGVVTGFGFEEHPIKLSQFGIVEMTRQRMRGSLRSQHFSPCPSCAGRGLVRRPASVAPRPRLFIMNASTIALGPRRPRRHIAP